MTDRLVKLGKGNRSQKVKQVEEDYETENVLRRAVLLSCNDVDKMAIESSRARLIRHLVSKSDDRSSREFASCYRGPTRYHEPPYSITSHTKRVPIPKRQQVIPAYPSLVNASQWCSYTELPSEQNSETDCTIDQRYNCRCLNCQSQNCPGKFSCRRLKKFKDNIMTFSDRYTMTPNVNDAGSGGTPMIPSTPKCSDVFVPCSSSMVTVKNAQNYLKMHDMYSRKCLPVPILKKGCPGPVYYDCCHKGPISTDFQDKAACDSITSNAKCVNKCSYIQEDACTQFEHEGANVTRKNIYNEGISDVVTDKFRLCHKKPPPSPPDCSKSSMSSKCYDSDNENYIPHSHKSESKYHLHCTKSPERPFVLDDGCGKARYRNVGIPSPKIVCKTYATKSCKRCKQPRRVIKLPKKVLTSQNVTDPCLDKHL